MRKRQRPGAELLARRAGSVVLAIVCTLPAWCANATELRARASPVRSCVNARLPRELVAGTASRPEHPLRTIAVAAPAAVLRLAVADDERTRETGLMCAMGLRPQHGMLFVFAFENDWEFWMKNTLVPLDMIWLTAGGEVTEIAADVPAATLSTPEAALARRHGRGLYVIELPAREAAADGIVVGTQLTLPALDSAR